MIIRIPRHFQNLAFVERCQKLLNNKDGTASVFQRGPPILLHDSMQWVHGERGRSPQAGTVRRRFARLRLSVFGKDRLADVLVRTLH
ncbi:hypothetical protein QT603_22530 [Xanthomonas citri pv. citri]